MNVSDAAHATVHDYPGGSESLAPRLGMSGALLRNKVNPHCDRNVLTLAEAVRITSVTDDLRMLHAWAAEHDCVVVPVNGSPVGDVLSLVMARAVREGDFSRVLQDALADGVITPNELAALNNAGGDLQSGTLALLRRLTAMQRGAPEVSA